MFLQLKEKANFFTNYYMQSYYISCAPSWLHDVTNRIQFKLFGITNPKLACLSVYPTAVSLINYKTYTRTSIFC